MSDTPRSYKGHGRPLRGRKPQPGPRSQLGWNVAIGAAVAAIVLFFWITRDNYSPTRFVPASSEFNLAVTDPLERRDRLESSRVWDAISAWPFAKHVPALLSENLAMPEWVFNNMIGHHAYMYGDDTKDFSDAILVTKMSRVGSFIEKFRRFGPSIRTEATGGLRLRYIRDRELYYTVRGRILVMSPKREALVRALTLPNDQEMPREVWTSLFNGSGGEDGRGVFTPLEDSELGRFFTTIRYAFRVNDGTLTVRWRADLAPGVKERIGSLGANAEPGQLLQAEDGFAQLSMNFQRPMEELWNAFDPFLADDGNAQKARDRWATSAPTDEMEAFARFVTRLVDDAGPGITLSWTAMDINAMVPAPRFIAAVESSQPINELMKEIELAPDQEDTWEAAARWNEESNEALFPLAGGSTFQLRVGQSGDTLVLTNNASQVDKTPPGRMDEPGNLYFSIQPGPAAEAMASAGRILAKEGLLADHTPETFEELATKRISDARKIHRVSVLIAIEDEEVRGTLTVTAATPAES